MEYVDEDTKNMNKVVTRKPEAQCVRPRIKTKEKHMSRERCR